MPRLLYFLILTLIIDNVSSAEILNKNSCVWDNEYGISCVEIKLLLTIAQNFQIRYQ